MISEPLNATRHGRIASTLQGILGRVLRIEPRDIDVEAPFLELGADSLALVEALRGLQDAYGVRMTIRQLFEQFPTISALAAFLDQILPAEAASPAPAPPPPVAPVQVQTPIPPPVPIPQAPLPAVAGTGMERVFGMQIQAFNQLVAQQLQMLGARPAPQPAPAPAPVPAPQPAASLKPVLPTYLGKAGKAPGAALTERQQRHLDALVERYCRKTAKSKELTQRYRSVLADSRATVGFRPMTKEMLYPLARAGGKGSRLWDVDGNEYIDLTMGMGVHLLGHAPDFLQETFERQVREGFEIGPRSAHSGEVAALFCELTGMERATFTNSGTEACMTAIRLARARTGRTKIVMFAGSYHGHSDGTLAQSQEIDGELRSFPVAPGIPPRVADDVLVLDYGTPRALEIIREHRHELAAVMVEPIQSRRPDLQPAGFLHELRRLTAESGIALIFDEMICGFRLHLGGAQAHFGIRADLATYGKIVGGGLPIGVVAGSAEYMDGIDGGMWRYGDDSRPERETTFFGGTFCQHPFAMSAAKEVLAYLKKQGPALQQDLNARTERFAGRLNDYFTADKVPIKAVHAHSLFRFNFSANAELLYYHLVEKGVYVWEWRNNFLSTAHTDADLDFVLDAVRESVEALREGGFLPDRPSGGGEKAQAFWGRPGIKPSLAPVASAPAEAPVPRADTETRFSLYFFGNYAADFQAGKYDLLVDCARFADREGFSALWFPERHFHAFGGFCPNPSVLASALARETERIALRAGSVVLPLHHPLRVAEEWSLVDNLSGGRIGLAYASGWHPNDFALAPESYGRHRDLTFERAEIIRRLWLGEAVRMKDGAGTEVDLRIYPLPARRDLPVWITIVNNPDTYRLAGEMGAGVLTNLMGQTIEGLAENLAVYREALAAAGHPPEAGRVTLLLHTFLGPDAETAVATARRPFHTYLESSVGLVKNFAASEGLEVDFDRLSREDFEYMLELAYQRYVKTAALIGSPDTCAPIVERMRSLGVDEIACLVDFGVDADSVRASLPWIAALKDHFRHRPAVLPEEAAAPLTESQRDLYMVAQIGVEASLAYLESGAVEMRGPLDLPSFQDALRQAVGRHEALRAVVPDPDTQVFRSTVDLEAPVVDVSALPADRREEAAELWIGSAARRPFDLEQGPLIRTSILRLGPRLHRLGLFVHHIAADGLSLSLFLEEVFTIYEAERAGCRAALQPAMRYRDYVAWLAAGGDEPDGIEGREAWWLRHLAGPLPVFEPPTDRPRPAVRTFRGSRRRLALDPALRDGLRAVGRRQGATLYTALLAAWSALLHRWTGQDDLIVGGPAARRPLEGGDRLVGHCVDLVAFRSRLDGEEPPFSRYLAAMRSQVLDVQERGVPFARLLRLLKLPPDPGRTPLVQTVFNFDPGLELTRAGGLELAEVSPPVPFVKFDLAVHVLESGEAPLLQLDYRADLFDAATLDRLLERFQVLVGGIVADPETPLGDLPFLTGAERNQLLGEWSGHATAYPRETPVHQVFEEVAERQPDAPAVLWEDPTGDQFLTYGELASRARSLALHLRRMGVGPETPVALDMERSPELITAMLGVLEAGGLYVPLDPADSSERRAWQLSDSGAKVVLTAKDIKDCKDDKDGKDGKDGDLSSLQPLQSFGSFESSPLGGDALACLLYTSGSTGRPKGVGIPHRGINRLFLETDYLRLGPGDRMSHLSNIAFDAVTLEVWGPLLTGAAIVVIPREVALSPAALGDAFRRWEITASFLTVALFNEMVREAPGSLSGVRNQMAGGEALSPRWVREALAQLAPGHRLLNAYGPTEDTTLATVHDIRSLAEGQSVPIGRPIANTWVYVVDRRMQPVPAGVAGELLVGGDGLARGYWGRPDLTAERFVPNAFGVSGGGGSRLYRTGDLVRWLPDGTLEFLGRTDQQVKVRGFRIEPGEIEAVLSRCPGIGQCAVIAINTAGREGKTLAAFATRTGAGPDVRSWLRERLPEPMVPSHVMFLEALPLTDSGKVDRRALAALPLAEEPGELERPRTPAETAVAAIWCEVLGRERVGRRDSFLDLGGHSLLAGRVLARLRDALGVDVPFADFFQEPTVEGLARHAVETAASARGGIAHSGPGLESGEPLSFAQQRLWFFDRLAPGSPLYNMPAVMRIGGPLRIAPLTAAVAEVVRRHDGLRTVFGPGAGDEPVQRVLPELPGPVLPVVDLSGLLGGARQAEADRRENEELRRPFSLERGPLFRTLLLRLGAEEHRAILHAHHIVSDGWSLGVLYGELAALYRAFAAGEPSPLPELPLRYVDFARWQREWLRGGVLEEQLAWWRERLSGLVSEGGLDMPADRPRPAEPSYLGGVVEGELPDGLSGDLLRLGQRHGATPFMVLAAAWLVLVHRHTHREDLALGFPMANRTRPEIEPLVGFFVNTLVLRARVSGEASFLDVLDRVREAAMGAWAHQDVPFERLVEELVPERALSRSPLFQLLFAYQGGLIAPLDLGPGLSVRTGEPGTGTSKFDLSLFLREADGGGLQAELEYSADLFDESTVRRFLDRFEVLAGGIVAAPQAPIGELPVLTAAERTVLLEWSGSEPPYPRETPVHRVFEEIAARSPEAPAVLWDGGSLSYTELDRWSSVVAAGLGIAPGTPVALEMERSPELIAAMLGVLKAGGFYVPLDPSDSSERRAWLHADSRAQVVLKAKDIRDCKDTKDQSLLSLQSLQSFRSFPLGGDALAYILYTSGSTGRPKGVAVPHRAINRLILETDYIHLGPEDRSAHLSNTAFDASTLEVWGPLLTGGSLVIIPRETVLSPAALGAAFREWRISVSFLTAALFNEVLREAPGSLGGVRNQLAGGEALSPRWVREGLAQLEPGCRLLNGYGPTECTTFAVVHDIRSAPEGRSIPIGRPIANTRAWVVDGGLRLVPAGVAGELLLGGDGLAWGYWGRPDLTAERFVPDPFGEGGSRLYRTGDLVRWLGDGTLEYLGRTDEQVKIRGFRIEPGEIESVLSRCPGVGECAVVAKQEAEGKVLLAFATRSGGPLPEVRAWLRERLPDYMVPSQVTFLDTLPRTSSGKVDRRALLSLGGPEEKAGRPYQPPRTPTEEIVAGIWADVLGLERVGLGEGFFDLGGHSLLAGRVLARLRSAFGVELSLLLFFLDPTVEALARRIDEALPQPAAAQAGLPPILPVPRDGRLPLSFAQQRLWFFDRLAPAPALYNVPSVLRIEGPLDVDALAAALREIVRRHEALRTIFPVVDDEPVQRILPEIPGLAVLDLPEEEREEIVRGFPLETGPLFRSTLLRIAPDEHRLILNAHHIVSDGWSLGVLSHELGELYRAFAAGRPSPLPELPVGYPDFAVRQREWLERGALAPIAEQLAWWKERLAGLPEAFDLPADHPRPPVQSWRGAVERSALPAEVSRGLLALGRRHGATPFMTLATVFFVLLHRHTSGDDLAVGFPTANRTRLEIEPLIGFFVNTLVLRADLSGEPGFLQVLGRVRDAALGAWAHQDLPFEKLVEALAPERDLSRNPLVQVLFAFQETVRMAVDLGPGLAVTPEDVDTGTSKFDLSLFLSESSGGGLLAEVEYATDLFEPATIRRILERLEVLAAGIVAVPEAPLGDLPLLTAAESRQILEWRGVEREYPAETPVHRVFEEVAARQPDAPAVVWDTPEGERSLSYGELARDAARLSLRLRELGVEPGMPVALSLPRSPEMITAMLAVLQAGAFYVPLDPEDTSERRAFLLEDSGATVVLGPRDLLSLQPLQSFSSWAGGGPHLAYMIYTSGSTGRPKGVAVPHRAINRLVLETDYYQAGPGDRIANLVNMTFDVSTWEVWGGLLLGAAVVVVPKELVLEPLVLADWLVKMRVDVVFLPVSVFNEVARERPTAFGAIRELFSGGEALTPRWVREALLYIAPGHRLVNGYGPTECTCWALTHDITHLEEGRSVPIGRPIPNTTAWVLDRALRPVPVGVPGELCLGGPGVAQGYWKRPDLTADKFVPDPFGTPGDRLYRTGDLARWLPDGTIEYLGRTDHQVKIRGYRIEPGEIENVLARCPGVAECAIVVRSGPEGRSLAAFVTAAPGAEPDVRTWLRAHLPEYMVPTAIVFQDALPKTSSGKIDRRALLAQDLPSEAAAPEGPRTPVEEIVAGVWAEVLAVDSVGLTESFFDLGGHSLLAGRVLARLRAAFGVDLPLRSFFADPTVRGLARRVEEARQEGAPALPPIIPIPLDARIPLSFAQQRLWFFDRLAPGSALYNMPVVLEIHGPLEVERLAAALDEIVRRHEPLRTVFALDGDEPVQKILPKIPGLALVDAELESWMQAELQRPFSLEQGPLFRSYLLRLGPEDHRLILHAHHSVSDGWSVEVILRELAALYRGEILPELPVRYADFAVWQRGWMSGEALDSQLAWWTDRLAGLPEGLDLPADHPRPAVQSYRGAVETADLPPVVRDLLRLGRRHGATPFMTLAAAFLAFVQRHTGRDDLAVGFPMAGRTRPEIEPLVGFFVNTLVLRVDLSGEPVFADLLGRVRDSALGAWAHQDLPFERLVEALAPERDLSRSPLVQVLFSYRSDAKDTVLAPGLVAREGEVDTGTSKFDLSLFVRDAEDGFRVDAELSTDLFDRGTVRRFLERFGILIEGIAVAPETSLGDLPLLSSSERDQVLVEWSGSEPAYPSETPIHQVFEEVAARLPEEPAVLWDGGALTYAELSSQSNALAHRLRGRGVGLETPVALDMERSPELIVAMLAVLKAGGIYVPLDPADSSERRAWLLENSQARVVLTPGDLSSLQPLQSFPSSSSGGNALAYILYTSGSTGRPKGVAVPHKAINRLILNTDYVHLGPGDRTAHLSNTAFDASTFEVWGALLTGGALVIFPREVVLSPAALGEAFRRWKISASFLTAALFNEVLREVPGSLGGVRNQLAGGEALSPRWVREALSQLEPAVPRNRLLNGYGPTEVTTFAVVHDIRSAPEGLSVPIGRPIANTRAYVLDRWMRPVPPGVAGELLLGGDGLARAYWGRPDLTAERFVPDPIGGAGERLYRTGDLVRWLPDGTLEYLGRTDAQVKIRGFRIEPGEIESVLSRCPGIGECAIVAIAARQEENTKALLAFATQAGPVPDVRSWLRERLPDYMVPSRIVFLETLPRTTSGKIDRRALLAWAPPPPDEEPEAFQAPRTPIEEIVAGIWSEVLERDRVGLGESFFDLGGHSLLASRTLARLRSTFGVDLPLRAFFLDPTVEGVARQVEEARRTQISIPPMPPIPRVSRDRRLPLSYAQERLWLVDQLQPGNAAYNSFLALTLSGGPVDYPALESALAEIVRRHESLRTRFVAGPEQVVDPPAPRRLPVIDLSGLEDPLGERQRLVAEEAYRPFDLARGPLFRASLIRVDETGHALLLNFHHIVCDGWSLTEVLPVELNALYRGKPLPELPIQVPDFAVWQREQLGDALDEQLAWWKERLGGAPPVLDLPYDHPRPEDISRGTVESLTLPAGLAEGLATLGRRHGATLFMTLLAGIQTLLQRYSHEDRIAVGTAVGNRPRHETEGLIGLFLNTLVLQTDLSGDLTCRDLLERVREVTLDAFDHQDLPFEKLVAAVSPGRNLFQVLFLLQNMRVAPLDLPGLATGFVEYPVERVQFELAFTAYEWDGRLILAAPYSTDLFDQPTIQRLLDNTRRLLEHMVEHPERPVSEAPLLSEAERRQIVLPEAPVEANEPETLEARLDKRQQQVAERLGKLTPERRSLLRKLMRKG